MKARYLVAALAALFAAPAIAADIPARTYAPAPVTYVAPPAFSWAGLYVGVNGSYVNGTADYTHRINSNFGGIGGTYSNDVDGWTVGVHGGYNMQFGAFVVGLEASAAYADVSGNLNFAQYYNNTTTKIGSLYTITPRLGFAITDNVLLFVKGGWAGGNVESGQVYAPKHYTATTWSNTKFHSGWTIGAGVDYALTQRVILGLEYNYVRLNDSTHSALDSGRTLTEISSRPDLHQVRAGVSYKF